MKTPCKDCQKRKLLCHGRCPDYQEYRAEIDEINKKRHAVADARMPLADEIIRKMKKTKGAKW